MSADLKRRLRALELRGVKSDATDDAPDLSMVDYSALSDDDLNELENLIGRLNDPAAGADARLDRLSPEERKRLLALIDMVIWNQPDQRPAPVAGSTEQKS